MTQPPVDPRAALAQPGDVWVSIGKPVTGIGGVKVRLNRQYLFFERGTLRTDSQQVPLVMVADVDSSQSMQQKMRGVGTVKVHVNRPTGPETVILEDLPDFKDGVRAINDMARDARVAEQRARNTQTMQYQGLPPQQQAAPAPVQPAAPSSEDVFAQLEKLGEMKDKGWISEDEFQSKKTELLGRI
ncbi:hypothetical protein GCM10027418_06490 [Mariniluteicoccus endophyticus]